MWFVNAPALKKRRSSRYKIHLGLHTGLHLVVKLPYFPLVNDYRMTLPKYLSNLKLLISNKICKILYLKNGILATHSSEIRGLHSIPT